MTGRLHEQPRRAIAAANCRFGVQRVPRVPGPRGRVLDASRSDLTFQTGSTGMRHHLAIPERHDGPVCRFFGCLRQALPDFSPPKERGAVARPRIAAIMCRVIWPFGGARECLSGEFENLCHLVARDLPSLTNAWSRSDVMIGTGPCPIPAARLRTADSDISEH